MTASGRNAGADSSHGIVACITGAEEGEHPVTEKL